MPEQATDDGYAGFLLALIAEILPRLRNRRLRRMLRHYQAILSNRQSGEPVTQPLIADYVLRALFITMREERGL